MIVSCEYVMAIGLNDMLLLYISYGVGFCVARLALMGICESLFLRDE